MTGLVLHQPRDTLPPGFRAGLSADASPIAQHRELSAAGLLAAVWRHKIAVGTWVLVTLGLQAIVILNLSPRYRAETMVALDTHQIQFSDVSAVVSNTGSVLDSNVVRSEVAILSSPTLARAVTNDLGLTTAPEFAPPLPRLARVAAAVAGMIKRCCDMLQPVAAGLATFARDQRPPPLSAADQLAATLAAYERNLSVSNDGRSYIITVGFSSTNPALAARIVNHHAEAYIEAQRLVKDRALATATSWLDQEVANLEKRLSVAETALQDYRDKHHLFSAGIAPIIQQNLINTVAQLSQAETDLIQRKSRLEAASNGNGAESMGELTGSDALNRLNERELAARDKLDEAISRLGSAHPSVGPLRTQLANVQQAIAVEQKKLTHGIADEVAIGRQRRDDLKRTVAELQRQLASTQRDQLGAQQLEREASALRALYESLLSRQKQVATQVGIQRADAYIVSPAAPPRQPYYPNTNLFFAVSLMLSAGSATGLAFLLDRPGRGFADLTQVETATGLPNLATIPRVEQSGLRGGLLPADLVANRPRSVIAESFRTLRNAIAFQGEAKNRVVAVTSFLPGDGKTTVALGLARSLAGPDCRVLLLEADLHRRTLAKQAMHQTEQVGLVAALTKACTLNQAVIPDKVRGVDLLVAETSAPVAQDLLVPPLLGPLIASARLIYDYVIVDTPPLSIVSDALLIARSVDTTFLVVAANRIPRELVLRAVDRVHAAGVPVMGTVLNWAEKDVDDQLGVSARRYRSATMAYVDG